VADDEMIGYCGVDLTQVERDDFLTFHGFHGLNRCGHNLFNVICLMSDSHNRKKWTANLSIFAITTGFCQKFRIFEA
jgi:hypothetical protein